MAIGLKSNGDGITGAIQVNGVDVVGISAGGIASSNVAVTPVGGVTATNLQAAIAELDSKPTSAPVFTYENRGDLRLTTPSADEQAIVEGLGMFVFVVGSDEPDDDETCFATGTGKWLLETPSWDYADEIFSMEAQSRVLYGQAVCPLASVTASTTASFTAEVLGATVGDNVLVAPPLALGVSTDAPAVYALVTDTDTITIYVVNADAASYTVPQTLRETSWSLTVFKGY
jgi:hypothetical protein